MFGRMHIQLQFSSPVVKDEDFSLRLALAPMAELHFQLQVSIVVFSFFGTHSLTAFICALQGTLRSCSGAMLVAYGVTGV